MIHRYVDILTNGGFKALFGDVNNKEAVMTIMNILLPEHRRVADIVYMPTEQQGQISDNKEYHYDFMCRDENGVIFIVEMQYGTDISHSDSSLWTDRFISEYTFREKGTGEVLDETIFITFAELARFNKRCTECKSDIDKMMYILMNMGRLKNRPEWLQREVYTKLFDACEIARFNEEKRIQYEKDMYDERRLKGEFAAAEKKGWEKGLEEAIRKMISAGMTVDQVASIMELPVEQVQAFKHD